MCFSFWSSKACISFYSSSPSLRPTSFGHVLNVTAWSLPFSICPRRCLDTGFSVSPSEPEHEEKDRVHCRSVDSLLANDCDNSTMSAMYPDESLNAGAATFTPGGGGFTEAVSEPQVQPDDLFYYTGEDEAWMEEIHAEMETQTHPPMPSQQQRVVLPPHAEEFWFPECRECTCCKGYKHGCKICCTTKGMQSCSCVGDGAPALTIGGGAPTYHRSSPPKQKTAPLCKFFTSPGGCRFGAKCRFAHS